MDYTELDDYQLIHLIVQQDSQALSTLYDRYNRLVFSLALNMISDRATAEV